MVSIDQCKHAAWYASAYLLALPLGQYPFMDTARQEAPAPTSLFERKRNNKRQKHMQKFKRN